MEGGFFESIVTGFPAMFTAGGEALGNLAGWQPMLALAVGVTVGVLNGAMPGGAVPSLIVLLGFAYGLDPYIALPLAIGMVATVPTGDTLPAVLLGMPGSTSGQATILDGNPLARRGRAGVALSAAYFASLLGGIIGAVFLFAVIPVARPVVRTFGAPEFFVLGLVAIAVVGVVSSGALLRGLMAGAFGLLIASVGYNNATGSHRLTFGIDYLWDGIHVIPVVIGLFALPEFFDMVVSDVSIARRAQAEQFNASAQRREGMFAVLRNWFLVIRSAAMGVFIGLLPGIGGSLAQWLSYASARQTVRGGTETFGTGDIRGVIAPESANNAVDGGQLVPTLFFGVPGSVGMALFLGLLIILDVRPGPDMLNRQLPLTMTIAFSLVLANVFATGLALGFTPLLTRIAFVRPNVLVPIILAVMTVAAFSSEPLHLRLGRNARVRRAGLLYENLRLAPPSRHHRRYSGKHHRAFLRARNGGARAGRDIHAPRRHHHSPDRRRHGGLHGVDAAERRPDAGEARGGVRGAERRSPCRAASACGRQRRRARGARRGVRRRTRRAASAPSESWATGGGADWP